MIKVIHCIVNGMPKEIAVDEQESLTDMLRQRLGLTSVKKGCEAGECGACTVLIDGVAKNSCIYLAVWADGHEIITVEDLKNLLEARDGETDIIMTGISLNDDLCLIADEVSRIETLKFKRW